jgi:ABC-type uncharacterized transport system auxiliary subunit
MRKMIRNFYKDIASGLKEGLIEMTSVRWFFVLIGFFVFLVIGCFGSRTVIMGDQYVLEYASPQLDDLVPLKEAIKVERFSSSADNDSYAMVCRQKPFLRQVNPYARWRILPADMISDKIVRDLRNVKIFRAVFSWRDTQPARFVIQGEVEEFLKLEGGNDAAARLDIRIKLLDTKTRDAVDRIVSTKEYKIEEPILSETAEEYAAAMSRATAHFSADLLRNIYQTVKERTL